MGREGCRKEWGERGVEKRVCGGDVRCGGQGEGVLISEGKILGDCLFGGRISNKLT